MNFYKIALLVTIANIVLAQNIYKNPQYSPEERAWDLVRQLTLEEKLSQIYTHNNKIERLNIPNYKWGHEALHGLARVGKATVFPQAIGLAATFDTALVYRVTTAISDEARAKYKAHEKLFGYPQQGLSFFSPNINIYRDPRWGRGMETYGEDPYLTARIGVNFVKGMQGLHPKYLKTTCNAKHYVVHSGPENKRELVNPNPTLKDFYETYLPAFKALIQEGNVQMVMASYNKINGIPVCANSFILKDVLRTQFGYKNVTITDGGALNNMHKSQKYTSDSIETCVKAINNGIDFELGNVFKDMGVAVKAGKVKESTIDSSLARLLAIRFRLGLFDMDANDNPYINIPDSIINCNLHRKLAREAAVKSIVMLKNNGCLPLSKNIQKLYVVGPNATNGDVLFGNYNGFTGNMSLPIEGLVAKLNNGTIMEYRPGARLDQEKLTKADWTDVSHQYDAIVAYMGLSPVLEGEEGEAISSPGEGDRIELSLPPNQVEYLKKQRSYGKKPIILVLFGGSPIINKEIYDLADAVLYCWYPGEEGGNAIADIIFGDENPSGRLPITFPMSEKDLPEFSDYTMKNRTYRYITKEPLFPFGFGLSYTSFMYEPLTLIRKIIKKGEYTNVSVKITNTGKFDGEEVVQLYVTLPDIVSDKPNHSLKGFKKIFLKAGESKIVQFALGTTQLNSVDEKGKDVLVSGKYTITLASSSPTERSIKLGACRPINYTIEVK
ncbi:MAG: glycoside hydrolase family 3 C-terminal domain-containing protein [Bacteroidota bacterium]|nr:glycoside hydrolase family 3 C-terminal domain-containing protein [Bacteroidota bacterium]